MSRHLYCPIITDETDLSTFFRRAAPLQIDGQYDAAGQEKDAGRQNQSGGQEEKAGDRNGLRMGEGRIRTQQGLEHPLEQKPGETAREGQSQTVEREIDPGQP